jgi:AraC family transcriptional regulator
MEIADGRPANPVALLHEIMPSRLFAASDKLGWVGLQAAHFRGGPGTFEIGAPPQAQHALVLSLRPPEKLDVQFEGVKRDMPAPSGSTLLVPAHTAVQWRWTGSSESLHIFLEPGLIARVAAESFELDPTRTEVRPLDGLNDPEFHAAMLAVKTELMTDRAGGALMIESLAHVLSVHLLRRWTGSRRLTDQGKGGLSRQKLNRVVEYIMANLDHTPTLEEMAAVAHLSLYHFARQFKVTTGQPPHQYVIARRVEWARRLLEAKGDESLAQIALRVGFLDQSQFSFHFKKFVGVTPGQFRVSARNA